MCRTDATTGFRNSILLAGISTNGVAPEMQKDNSTAHLALLWTPMETYTFVTGEMNGFRC